MHREPSDGTIFQLVANASTSRLPTLAVGRWIALALEFQKSKSKRMNWSSMAHECACEFGDHMDMVWKARARVRKVSK